MSVVRFGTKWEDKTAAEKNVTTLRIAVRIFGKDPSEQDVSLVARSLKKGLTLRSCPPRAGPPPQGSRLT
jgi:hypothetical protein